MSQYIRKGDINDEKGYKDDLRGRFSQTLIRLFDKNYNICDSNNLSQFLMYFFKLCDNGDVKLSKSTIEYALNECKNEKCKEMLNQYVQNEYE